MTAYDAGLANVFPVLETKQVGDLSAFAESHFLQTGNLCVMRVGENTGEIPAVKTIHSRPLSAFVGSQKGIEFEENGPELVSMNSEIDYIPLETREFIPYGIDHSVDSSPVEQKAKKGPKSHKDTDIIRGPNVPKALLKYYIQRHKLFSKYDQGILLNYHSWFSVTCEAIAQHMANRFKHNLVIDAFCGSGGNTIQFALAGCKVIAIDLCSETLKLCMNNARIYNVEHMITFVHGDFLELNLDEYLDSNDVGVFASPPWGGVKYLQTENLGLGALPVSGFDIITKIREYSCAIMLYLPRNINIQDCIDTGCKEIETVFLDTRNKGLAVYYR